MKNKKSLTARLPFSIALAAFLATPMACQAAPEQKAAPAISEQAAFSPDDKGLVSSADPRATAAGQEILRKGGSAADAAMAMMLALTVVEPQSSGIGGGGFFIYHDSKSGGTFTIDGRETAPMATDDSRFLDKDGKPLRFFDAMPGGLSVGVPGNIRLMEKVHAKWGKLPWADIFQPAIKLARQGYQVNDVQARWLERLGQIWQDFPEAQKLYWKDGAPKKAGDMVVNTALADFLTILAENGADSFYHGDNAAAIVKTVTEFPRRQGDIALTDLSQYQAKERAAVCSRYRSYKICSMGPPSSGAVTVQQILGMIEGFDLHKMGKDDPKSWHVIGEAMQLAYADRNAWLGDADFVDVPVHALLDKGYLSRRAQLISPDKAGDDHSAGQPVPHLARTEAPSSEVSGTTHFVARDGDGNIVSMTSTVEGPFGSQLIVNGYVLNNELTDFTFAPEENGAKVANRVEAGKRPLSSMSPTIVYDAMGRPVMAVGSAGGKRIIMHVTKSIIGFIDFGLNVEQAMALPNIYYDDKGLILEDDPLTQKVAPALRDMGHGVTLTDLGSKLTALQHADNGWIASADPRSPGKALSE